MAATVFTKVVDTSTPVPGGSGNFSFFGSDPAGSLIGPVYSEFNGDHVTFSALDAQNRGGIYRWDSGTLTMAFNTATQVPGKTTTFAHFTAFSGTTLFRADDGTQTGIYWVQSGQLLALATTDMNAPGTSSHFTGFSRPALGGPDRWYSAAYSTSSGLHSAIYDGFAVANPRVGENTPVPGGTGNFTYASNPDYSIQGYILFYGTDANQKPGIYRFSPNNSTLALEADTNTTIPGTNLKFASFDKDSLSAADGIIAFSGKDQDGHEYIIKRTPFGFNNKLQIAGAGHGPIATSDQYLAFVAGNGSIFTDSIHAISGVIGPGDTLFGKTVSSLFIGPDSFDDPKIAFLATFTDGSQGIYIATLLPEPGALAMLGVIPFLMLQRRRRNVVLR